MWQGAGRHAELPRQRQPEPADKWSLLRQPSLSVPALDDIVTKILNDDGADVEPPMAALIGHETGDVMLHADQWDHAELSDISAKSQSCTSDVFSFDGYECNNNTNICNTRSVSKHTESEAQAVAR